MRFKPYGIYTECKHQHHSLNADDYSNELYEGVRCGYDHNDRPVAVLHCKKDTPYSWKVVYGFSTVFFESFKEAMDFCKSRNMTMLREYEDERE